jgi:hypothetical protein
MKTTAYFREVVCEKHPGIAQEWILQVTAEPLERRQQADGRFVFWGVVPEAGGRVLRVVTLEDSQTVHNAFFDRGFRRSLLRGGQPALPDVPGP